MLFEFAMPFVHEAEAAAAAGHEDAMWMALRRLSLDDFGRVLMGMPDERYPGLSARLPAMAADDVQVSWTGSSGGVLLRQSVSFIRTLKSQFETVTGRSISNSRILDYGCGWGRMLRLLLRYTDAATLAGCDPWDRSIEICRESRLPCRLDVTDYLPKSLPYPAGCFDLAFAFSVFTHTSLRASSSALAALRPCVADEGLLAITIRPIEYWDYDTRFAAERSALKAAHRAEGFAFAPHNRAAVDGDVTYGDTSMSFEFLEKIAPAWRIASFDRTMDDPYQIVVYLKPA